MVAVILEVNHNKIRRFIVTPFSTIMQLNYYAVLLKSRFCLCSSVPG